MFVFPSLTTPAGSGLFPQSLPTPALDRHDTAAVWVLRLHGEPGGPTSITSTARLGPTIFHIVIPPLSGHTTDGGIDVDGERRVSRSGACSPGTGQESAGDGVELQGVPPGEGA